MSLRLPLLFVGIFFLESSSSFSIGKRILPPTVPSPSTRLFQTDSSIDYSLTILEGDESSISQAAYFMMDNFWIQPFQILQEDVECSSISEQLRNQIAELQRLDFQDKYGQVFGKRVLNSCMIAAVGDYNDQSNSEQEILGLVCIDGRSQIFGRGGGCFGYMFFSCIYSCLSIYFYVYRGS